MFTENYYRFPIKWVTNFLASLFQESMVQEVLARQLSHSMTGPVFPGLPLPLYSHAAMSSIPQMSAMKERSESSAEDSQSG